MFEFATSIPVTLMIDMMSLMRSLFIASFFAFLVPLLLLTGLVGTTALASHVPGIAPVGQELNQLVLQFLQVFGSGHWMSGVLTIAIACSVVGFLFDAYLVFYHQYHRTVHNHPMQ